MKQPYKIFDLEYLQNEEFSEDDLIYLFETPSFNYSLIIGMFNKYDKRNLSNEKIVSIITTDDKWMYKHYWNREQREEFIEILEKCYYNLYRYHKSTCKAVSDMWIVQYGFTSAKQKKKKMLLLSD